MNKIAYILPVMAFAGLTACSGPGYNEAAFNADPISVQTVYFHQVGRHTYVDPDLHTYHVDTPYGQMTEYSFYPGSYHYLRDPVEGHF